MATSGKEWRRAREEGIDMGLPSGHTARLRPIEVDFFARVGQIPDILAPLINEIISGKKYVLSMPPMEELQQKREWVQFLNELVTYAFVSPKVVDVPQADDEISIDDVSYVDKYFIYLKFTLPAHEMEKFRQKQADAVATLDPSAVNGKIGVTAPET